MNASDYLAGMTRSEALNYISNLPGLNRDEYFDLINEAEKKPEHRHYSRNTVEEKTKAYIKTLVKYLKRKRKQVNREQIQRDLKWNGSILSFVLRTAQDTEIIEKQYRGTYSYYQLKKVATLSKGMDHV